MKITEKQLRGIIRESLKELSRDTIDIAAGKASEKFYSTNDEMERDKRREQYHKFNNAVAQSVKDNPRAKLKLKQEREARKNGTRVYHNGKWTYVNESLDEHEYWTDPQSGVEYGDDFEPTDNFSDEEIAEMFGLPQDGPSDEDYSESMRSLDDAINEAVGQALKKLGKKAKDAYDKYMDEPSINDVTNGKCSTYGDAQKKGYTRGFNPMKWKN